MKGKLLTSKRISIGPVKLSDAKNLAQYFNETKHFLGAETVEDITIGREKDFIKKINKQKILFSLLFV